MATLSSKIGTLTLSDILDAGTAAGKDTGTSAGNVVELDGSGRLPAINGSLLTNLPASFTLASTAQVRAKTNSPLVLTTENIRAALGKITPSGASNWTPDWTAFLSCDYILSGNRTINNPSTTIEWDTRQVLIKGSNSTPRTISWGSQYKGAPAETVTSTKYLLCNLTPISSGSEIAVSWKVIE